MEKRSRQVLMAIVAVGMLPLSAWAGLTFGGQVNQIDGVIIKKGFCQVHPYGRRVAMYVDGPTGQWVCEGLGEVEGNPSPRLRVWIQVFSLPLCSDASSTADLCLCASGEMVNGKCYVRGFFHTDCNSACNTRGMVYDSATKDLIGSGGNRYVNSRRCYVISKRFGGIGGTRRGSDRARERLGCTQDRHGNTVMFRPGPTTAEALDDGFRRICACKKGED